MIGLTRKTHLFLAFTILSFVFSSCTRTDNFPAGTSIFCDAEQLNKKGDKFIAANDSSFFFDGGQRRTSLEAHSGKYSALTLPKKNSFALGHTIKKAGPDWYFVVSVWRKSKDGNGVLVATSKNPKIFYEAIGKPIAKDKDGWEKLEMEVYTPPNFDFSDLAFYVWNNGTDSVFFDDIRIERSEKKIYPTYDDSPLILILDTSDFIKIYDKRKRAFELGVLQSADDDWIKGMLVTEDEVAKAKLRLKGDWLDHLKGEKWSYRIKMRKSFSWNRLRVFSVQTPLARDFLREWEAHKFFRNEGLLTTRYGFIPLIINNRSRGIYAWEEHFVKQLLEYSYRREGPILKFTEDAFWQMQRNNLKRDDGWYPIPFYEAAVIEPFEESKTVRSPNLYQQFLNGQKLMYQYKHNLASPSEIFDIEKMAAYFAMMDLMKISHGKAWHNQRFYFNPVLCKLEPIAFDGYSDHSVFVNGIMSNTAYTALNSDVEITPEQELFYQLFADSTFIESYLATLEEISDDGAILYLKKSIADELNHYDSLIRMEFPNYNYDNDFLVNNAKEIRAYLPELKKFIAERFKDGKPEFKVKKTVYLDTLVIDRTPELLVNAYLQKVIGDSTVIHVDNYTQQNILLLGTGRKAKTIRNFFHPEPELDAYTGNEDKTITITSDTNSQFLFFMLKGRFETYVVPIYQWPFPEGKTSQQQLMEFVDLDNNPLIEKITGKDIFIKKGNLKTNRPFVIPAGYQVHFSAGTSIDFVEQALFLSYSPIFINGTKNNPVTITSSDFSAQGFTILQAGGRSKVNHANFENFNTLDYKGWTLTGAVTFYESDVDIVNTTFYRNQCEDALNTIRSDFKVENSIFEYIFGDAFDSDFCTGLVDGTHFKTIGNDAIDFSGSRITIQNVLIEDTEDKGISGGEESFLTVENTVIKRAGIGLASKDLSAVKFENGEIADCKYGLVLLQKKPEYGPASIIFNNSKILKPETEMLIEMGSVVEKDGETIEGKKEKLADIFYQ